MLNQVILVGRLRNRLNGYYLDVDGDLIPLRLEDRIINNIISADIKDNSICGVKGKLVVEWDSLIVKVEKMTYLSPAKP